MGDFNLDGGMNIRPDYSNKLLLNHLRDFSIESDLIQVVDFNTWSRTINGNKKESLLDHIYVNDILSVNSVYSDTPILGDHLLVMVKLYLNATESNNKSSLTRNWSKYCPFVLNNLLLPKVNSKCYICVL